MVGKQARQKPLVFAALLPTFIALSAAGDTLVPGQRLEDGNSLVSSDGSFKLGFFTPGKSKFRYLGIWYNQISLQTVVWVANRDRPLPDNTGVLSISIDGNLSLSDSKGMVYWSTSTRLAGPVAKLRDDANFAVQGAGEDGYAWQSFDNPTDAFLPGMKLWVNRSTGFTRNFTSWKSDDDPGTGDCTFFLDSNGDPQIIFVHGSDRVWRSGPWVGGRFSGIPEMRSYVEFNFSFVSNADEAYYNFSTRNKSLVSRMVAKPEGLIQRLVWEEAKRNWNVYWSGPRDRCDNFGFCGIFGVCDANKFPLCSCLQGFEPKSPESWQLRDGRDGCRRRTAVDCQNGTDGFLLLANSKLPDTSGVMVNEMATEECREACLRNCSCTAYAMKEMMNGGRSSCILWSGVLADLRVYDDGGQDLFVRLARADIGTTGEKYLQIGWNSSSRSDGVGDSPTASSHCFNEFPTVISGDKRRSTRAVYLINYGRALSLCAGLPPGKANRRRVVAAVSATTAAVLVGILLLGLVVGFVRRRRKSSNTG
ncbi:unnamed protein product [Spirodela intermedia]|uniref:Uncharacterized protein n=1 Tax=Spirodela intermedia TaxID=51605 RepID=A0A7I8L6K3_SPIIN|nr:unnamed protein product [Spirodela intermedia]